MAARPPIAEPTTGPVIELFDDEEEWEADVDGAKEVDDDNVAAEVVLVAFPLRPGASRWESVHLRKTLTHGQNWTSTLA